MDNGLKAAEVPAPHLPLLKLLGPGVILLSLSQGSGELIWWPYLVGRYGLAFVCLLLPAALLQWPISFEIGRYTVATGESIFAGLARFNRVYAAIVWLLFTLSFLWFGVYATAGGTALAELTSFPDGWSSRGQSLFWANVCILLFAAVLFLSRGAYRVIERAMMAVAIVTTALLLFAVLTAPEVQAVGPDFWRSVVDPTIKPTRPWDPGDGSVLVTALLFAGLGGFWNLFYSNWIRRKPFGMSAVTIGLPGTRAEDSIDAAEARIPEDTHSSKRNYQKWLRILLADSGIGIVGNLATTLLLCWLAFAYLTPDGTAPNGWQLASVQAVLFGKSIGDWGRIAFLLIAALFLADTWLTTVDSVARAHGDFILGFSERLTGMGRRPLYYGLIAILTVVTWVTMWQKQPGTLLLFTGVLNAAAMLICYVGVFGLNYYWLPRAAPAWVAPKRLSWCLMIASVACYVLLFSWYARAQF